MIITVYSNDTSIEWGVSGEERIVQNVKNLLRTRQFEVPFMRAMGMNQDFIDSTVHTMKTEFTAHVKEVINAYEERANVVDVRIESCDESGEYVIAVDLEV